MLFVPMAGVQNDGMSKNKKETAVILLVEQKTGGFVVLSTPLIELPIQKTLAKAENHN